MTRKQKLELTWVGKDERPRLEPRILLEDPSLSYHAKHRVSERDRFDNMLIQGDNLLALKALEQEFAGKVKCVFIDPPYNTGSAFEHYDDGIEHSLWLSMMRDRLILLRTLLSADGSIWITLDDNEQAYCKVVADEVFGRANFVANIAWMKRASPANDAKWFSTDHDNVLIYAKSKESWRPVRLPRTQEDASNFSNPDNDPRGDWNSGTYTCGKSAAERPNLYYPILHPKTGKEVWPKRTAVWRFSKEAHEKNVAAGLLWWGQGQNAEKPRIKRFASHAKPIVPRSVWMFDETGHTQEATIESQRLFPGAAFATPKPERLLKRILEIASQPGDLVLDSFLGSGTTAAVAHKMRRSWIGVEIGEHAVTHCVPRLRMVIDGEETGGATEPTRWNGGGGFRFYRLAPSLLEKDQWGNWVISREYNAAMLAEAVCKLEGFHYEPNPEVFWQQGRSTERDYLYVTTQTLNATQLEWLSAEVGAERSLLVLCNSWLGNAAAWPNLTLKKIPNAVLGRCEFGRDDYSLQIADLPAAPESATAELSDAPAPEAPKKGKRRKPVAEQPSLLDPEPGT